MAVRIDSGGDLALLDRVVTRAADGAGALFRGKSGGGFKEAIDGAVTLLFWHRKKARIFGLTVREGKRSFDRGAERVFLDSIGGGASGAAIGDSANGDG